MWFCLWVNVIKSRKMEGHRFCSQLEEPVQFSCSVILNSLWPTRLQHTRLSCPSPTPRVYSNSCHWVGDAIQPSHPLLSPTPPTFNLSQHQGLFKWVSSSHQVAKILEFQLQHQSFQWIFRTEDWLDLLQSKGLSRVFSNTTVLKHQFFGPQLSLYSNSHINTWHLEKS